MYAGSVLYFIGMPLLLGSWWGLLFVPLLTAGMAFRSVGEEKMLAANSRVTTPTPRGSDTGSFQAFGSRRKTYPVQRQFRISGMSCPCAHDIALVLYQLVADRLFPVGGRGPEAGHVVDHAATRWKRSRRLRTTMSNGVVVEPSSSKPCTWKLPWLAACRRAGESARVAVKGKDHRLVRGEQRVEIGVA